MKMACMFRTNRTCNPMVEYTHTHIYIYIYSNFFTKGNKIRVKETIARSFNYSFIFFVLLVYIT